MNPCEKCGHSPTPPTREERVIEKARKHVADSSRWGRDGSVVFLQEDDTYWRLGDVLRAYDLCSAERDAAVRELEETRKREALSDAIVDECDSDITKLVQERATLRARLAACESSLREWRVWGDNAASGHPDAPMASLDHEVRAAIENRYGFHAAASAAAGREVTEAEESFRTTVAQVLAEMESALNTAYHSATPVCCDRPGESCCGSPEPYWGDTAKAIMDTLGPMYRQLTAGHPPHTPLPSVPQVRSVTIEPLQFTLDLDIPPVVGTPHQPSEKELV